MKSHGKSKAVLTAVIFEVNLLQSSRFGEALRMEGFFAACGLPDILERSPRGERPAARLRHRPCLMEDRCKHC